MNRHRSGWALALVVPLLFLSALLVPSSLAADGEGWVAIKTKKIITVSGEEIENGTIVILDGKIEAVGEEVEVPDETFFIDASDLIVMPGLVSAHSRHSLNTRARNGSKAHLKVADEFDFDASSMKAMVEHGFTTVGLYPAGRTLPGTAAVIKTVGPDGLPVILDEDAYVRMTLTSSTDKNGLRQALRAAHKEIEKVDKARKAWEEKQKKAEEEAKKKAEAEKKKKEQGPKDSPKKTPPPKSQEPPKKPDKAAAKKPEPFKPPKMADASIPIVDLIQKKKGSYALIELGKASDYLQLEDVFRDEDIAFHLVLDNRARTSTFGPGRDWEYVIDKIGDKKLSCLLMPYVNTSPYTRTWRNFSILLQKAGATVSLRPRGDGLGDLQTYLADVASVVRAGLKREDAFRAMTMGPAEMIGLADRVGSIQAGRDADLLFFDGDPLEPTSKVQKVMIEGRTVYDRNDESGRN